MKAQNVVTMGVHVLDVLVRPVEEIPEGQGATLVEDIRMTAADTAAGTALTLAKLGASVRTAGAIGTDPTGDLLTQLLDKAGIDTGLLVRRIDTSTSATVLPIRPNGDRPTLHLLGANITYGLDDVPWDAVAEASHLHLGGPELIGAEVAARILAHAKDHGVTTSVDLLAPGEPRHLRPDRTAAPVRRLPAPQRGPGPWLQRGRRPGDRCEEVPGRGVGLVAVTRGGDGALLVTAEGTETIPAFEVEVVDTTGCGDAFSAGFLRGVGLDRTPREAAILGSAAAALVAQGLGSDHGDFDLAEADEFSMTSKTRA